MKIIFCLHTRRELASARVGIRMHSHPFPTGTKRVQVAILACCQPAGKDAGASADALVSRSIPESYSLSCKDWHGLDVGETLMPLLASIDWYHQHAHSDLAKLDFQKALLAISDVERLRKKEAKTHGSQYTEVIHQVLRIHLLDILRWAQYSHGSIPVQCTSAFNIATSNNGKKDNLLRLYNSSITSWLETTKSMTQEFLLEAPKIGKTSVTLEGKSDIVMSLLREVKQSSTDVRVSSVVINVCAAALGLYALLAVSCQV